MNKQALKDEYSITPVLKLTLRFLSLSICCVLYFNWSCKKSGSFDSQGHEPLV